MAGLREKQKADRHLRILDAATALFRAGGYEAARIEDIAEAAAVSVGTFYNYFATKGDLLLAIVAMEVEEVLVQGEMLLADPPRDVEAAISLLIDGYFDHSLVYLTKEMWRTAMAQAIQAPETPFGRVYTGLDARLSGQVCALLTALQRQGVVRAGVDTDAAGEMIFNNLNAMFTDFVTREAVTLADLKAAVRRQNRPLTRLIGIHP